MKSSMRSLESIVNNEAREFALYTISDRAIPSMIDGFKPSQRFFMHSAITLNKNNRDKFFKVDSVGGSVSDIGYHHGEESAKNTGKLMANTWNNNIAVLDGDGNFGSRLVQEAAASRYVFCRVSKDFWSIYKDFELAPAHPDPEHKPPMYYLPVIPMVLANGIRGVGTGYSANIFPHSKESLIKCTELALKGKLDREPDICFPQFKGNIVHLPEGGIMLEGLYELSGKTKMIINELPEKYDRMGYIAVLDKLEADDKIASYKDLCGKHGFKFEVTFKRNSVFFGETDEERHEMIMKMFKLRQKMTQNINVLDENRNLVEYGTSSQQLIIDFVNLRRKYVQKRIEHEIACAEEACKYANAQVLFITEVINNRIQIAKRTRSDVLEQIKQLIPQAAEYSDKLLSMPMYRMTEEEVKRLEDEQQKQQKMLEYWKNTTADKEYLKDLKAIK